MKRSMTQGVKATALVSASPSRATRATAAGGNGPGPLLDLPMGVVLVVLSFLDAEGLMACARTCSELWELSDYNGLWKNLALHMYPLTTSQDLLLYHNDPKLAVLDRNRRHRVLSFEFDVGDVDRADRRYSPIHHLEGFSFQLIVDPTGNNFVSMTRPGVSVYLSCCPTDRVMGVDSDDGRMLVTETEGEDWQCCAAFSLSIANASRVKRDQTWHSNLADDRFHPGCREWGVHRLLSLRRLKDTSNGWVDPSSGAFRVVARLRLLHMGLKIVTGASLGAHRGFGVVDPTSRSLPGAIAMDVPQCIKLSVLRWQVAAALGLASPDQLRLWVLTQPWAESVSSPRVLLTEEEGVVAAEDSLLVLPLLGPHMDGINEVRLWAEVGGDGGYEQTEDADTAAQEGTPLLSPTLLGAALRHPTMMPEPVLPMDPAEPPPPPIVHDPLFVLFLKHAHPQDGLRHLTHVLVKASLPLREIYALVSRLLGLPPQDLVAFAEAPPALWQQPPLPQPRAAASTPFPLLVTKDPLDRMRLPCPSADDHSPPFDTLTLQAAGVENGQVLSFCAVDRVESLQHAYKRLLSGLLDQARSLYYHTGSRAVVLPPPHQQQPPPLPPLPPSESPPCALRAPSPRRLRPRLSFEALTDLFERLGHQRFRIRNAFFERQHKDARETLEYAIIGRHLGFCCDQCAALDFSGPRYKCTICFDYDLCSTCFAKASETSFDHRYRFDHREWKKEDFTAHQRSHAMQVIPAIPHCPDIAPLLHHMTNTVAIPPAAAAPPATSEASHARFECS